MSLSVSFDSAVRALPGSTDNRAFMVEELLKGGLIALAAFVVIGGFGRSVMGRTGGLTLYALTSLAGGYYVSDKSAVRGAAIAAPGLIYFTTGLLGILERALRRSPAAGIMPAGALPLPALGFATHRYVDHGAW